MANCCLNEVSISGSQKEIKRFIELVSDDFDFNKIIPLYSITRQKAAENWGCNSESYDTEHTYFKIGAYWIFVTNWNPPRKIFLALKKEFPKLAIVWKFREPMEGLKGKWVSSPK